MTTHLTPPALHRVLVRLLEAGGCASDIASEVADNLIDAELAGHGSHGSRQINLYLERLRSGAVDGRARPVVSQDLESVIKIAGNRAFGQIAGEFAAKLGTARALENGACIVTLNGAGHLGRNGRWAEIAASRGVGSMHFGQGIAGAGPVAPYGGRDGRLNTNPLAMGFPGADAASDITFDCSTAEIAGSRIKQALERGEQLETNCLVKTDGTLTRDPAEFVYNDAAVLPFGGFKGYAISVFTELLSAVLATEGEPKRETNSLFSVYYSVASFVEPARFKTTMEDFRKRIVEAPPVVGVDRVRLPGDRARSARERHEVDGIALTAALGKLLGKAALYVDIADEISTICPELANFGPFVEASGATSNDSSI